MFVTRGTEYTMSRVLPSGIPDPEFRSKLILPWNDLIPMCFPPEPGNSAEYPEFRKMRTGINQNTNRNAVVAAQATNNRTAITTQKLLRLEKQAEWNGWDNRICE